VTRFITALLIIFILVAGYFIYQGFSSPSNHTGRVVAWIRNPDAHPEWAVKAGERCPNAPFLIPSSGFIGFLWDDSFRIGHRHQGIDIFGADDLGQTQVLAAYDGYLTRLPDWKSSVIIRVPNDPLVPDRQIWLYYTHMADENGNSYITADYPAGTSEVFVKAGTLLGYQGNYSGDPNNPVGVHLHFSIVRDNGKGKYLNELDIRNTLDPSPYLGIRLNAHDNPADIPVCSN